MDTLLSHPPGLPLHLSPVAAAGVRRKPEVTYVTALDYGAVQRYWDKATPSLLGPYVMDGFGFPAGAGRFRLEAEFKIVRRMIREVPDGSTVLDLGSGIGHWTEFFAQRFRKVVSVEASETLYEALERRCARYDNVTTVHGDVLSFEPNERYGLVFFGGMLMYLNQGDVVTLLTRLKPFLAPQGVMVCRETTLQSGDSVREGDYQAIYRSPATYCRIFTQCALSVTQATINTPYVLVQMGCEGMRRWKTVVPRNLQALPVMGRLVYWGLRLISPWVTGLSWVSGIHFPRLTNQFFLLHARNSQSHREA